MPRRRRHVPSIAAAAMAVACLLAGPARAQTGPGAPEASAAPDPFPRPITNGVRRQPTPAEVEARARQLRREQPQSGTQAEDAELARLYRELTSPRPATPGR